MQIYKINKSMSKQIIVHDSGWPNAISRDPQKLQNCTKSEVCKFKKKYVYSTGVDLDDNCRSVRSLSAARLQRATLAELDTGDLDGQRKWSPKASEASEAHLANLSLDMYRW